MCLLGNQTNYIARWKNKENAPDSSHFSWAKLSIGMGEEPHENDKSNVLGNDKDGNTKGI